MLCTSLLGCRINACVPVLAICAGLTCAHKFMPQHLHALRCSALQKGHAYELGTSTLALSGFVAPVITVHAAGVRADRWMPGSHQHGELPRRFLTGCLSCSVSQDDL